MAGVIIATFTVVYCKGMGGAGVSLPSSCLSFIRHSSSSSARVTTAPRSTRSPRVFRRRCRDPRLFLFCLFLVWNVSVAAARVGYALDQRVLRLVDDALDLEQEGPPYFFWRIGLAEGGVGVIKGLGGVLLIGICGVSGMDRRVYLGIFTP